MTDVEYKYNDVFTTVFIEILLQYKYKCESIMPYTITIDEDCVYCLDTMKDKYVIKLPCGHIFHRNCFLEQLLVHKITLCPCISCRKDLLKSFVYC